MHAALTRLPMIEKESVHATQTIIVQIMDNRNPQLEGKFVDSRRHRREDVMDQPIVVMPQLLIVAQLPDNIPIRESLQYRDSLVKNPTGKRITARRHEETNVEIAMQCIPNAIDTSLFTTVFPISGKHLQNSGPNTWRR